MSGLHPLMALEPSDARFGEKVKGAGAARLLTLLRFGLVGFVLVTRHALQRG
jgi:hypothetical protein